MTPRVGLTRPQLLGIAGAASLVPLNSTMVAVALPRIAGDFDITAGRTSLLVTVYLVAMLAGQPVAGRLGDAIGTTRAIRLALFGFLAASVTASLAPSFWLLVAARVGQAAAGAALVPNVQALLRAASPPAQRGRNYGLLGAMLGAGAASGPVVGGVLIQAFGWQAIFLVNLPVIALALAMPMVVVGAETHLDEPHLAGATWRNPVFLASFAIQALTTLGQYMLLLVAPILLDARGWSSGATGLALSALTVGMIVVSPIGGRVSDAVGRRLPTVAGAAAATVALVVTAAGGRTIDPTLLVAALAIFGVGLGFAVPSFTAAALESVPGAQTGAAAGVLSTGRYVGSIATSLLVAAQIQIDGTGAGPVLTVAAAASGAAVLLAGLLPTQAAAAAPAAPGAPARRRT